MSDFSSEDAEQVNCEMYHLNSAMKCGFDVLENKRATITINGNGLRIELSNSKYKRVSDMIIPGCKFLQGKELIQNMTSIATCFDHPHKFQWLNNV